jgi:hypothetical protein
MCPVALVDVPGAASEMPKLDFHAVAEVPDKRCSRALSPVALSRVEVLHSYLERQMTW